MGEGTDSETGTNRPPSPYDEGRPHCHLGHPSSGSRREGTSGLEGDVEGEG